MLRAAYIIFIIQIRAVKLAAFLISPFIILYCKSCLSHPNPLNLRVQRGDTTK